LTEPFCNPSSEIGQKGFKSARHLAIVFYLVKKQSMRSSLLAFFLLLTSAVQSQDMLKALRRQHDMYRFGVGVQLSDPLALNLQLFRGFFCSNDDTYATNLVWELTGGLENVTFQSGKDYKTGKWMNGGFQSSLSAHYPVANILARGFTLQFYAGLGLQGGMRKYRAEGSNNISSEGSSGGNASAHVSWMGRGIPMGNGVWFVTVYGGAKFHKQFGEDFNYLRPSLGFVLRKAR
jgi:hypothetical protein